MDIQEKEALIAEIERFKEQALKMHTVQVLADTYERSSLFDYSIDSDGSVIWYKAQAHQLWDFWQAKTQAVPESRTDFEIIDQTIQLVDLLANSNRFQRDKSKPFPFESENPRNMEWWRLACHIQELLTDTDPNNCDFEEYKAMIETQEQIHV